MLQRVESHLSESNFVDVDFSRHCCFSAKRYEKKENYLFIVLDDKKIFTLCERKYMFFFLPLFFLKSKKS
jgi:hypothetical protein